MHDIIGLQFTKDGKQYKVVGDNRICRDSKTHPWYKKWDLLIQEVDKDGKFVGETIPFTEEELCRCQISCSHLL